MSKLAIMASVFIVGYLLFHPEQPSSYPKLDKKIEKIQTENPDIAEPSMSDAEVLNRDVSRL